MPKADGRLARTVRDVADRRGLPTDGGPHIQEYVPAIEGTRNDTEGEVLALRPALPPLRSPALSNRRLLTAGRWPVIGNGKRCCFVLPLPSARLRLETTRQSAMLLVICWHFTFGSSERGWARARHLLRGPSGERCSQAGLPLLPGDTMERPFFFFFFF